MKRTLIRTVAAISISLVLSSCGTIPELVKDAVLPDGKGVDVTANVGKVETEKGSAQQGETNIALTPVDEIEYQAPIDTVVNESGLEWWELAVIVLLAGWAIPSPAEMLRGILRFLRDPLGRGQRTPS